MWISTISCLPDMFQALNHGITGKAIENGLLTVHHLSLRDYATDKHKTIDDRPFGGGPGMILMAEPLSKAIDAAKKLAPTPAKVIYLSPQGKTLNQASLAKTMIQATPLILIAGRYEGVDERVIETMVDEEWSIGDYVMSGGELAAMVVIDSIARMIPGCLGHEESARRDSFMNDRLTHPQYTRPAEWRGLTAPAPLLSGDHKAIANWRLKQSIGRSKQRKSYLLEQTPPNQQETALLNEFMTEYNAGETHE